MSQPKTLDQIGAIYARALAKDIEDLVGAEVPVKAPEIEVVEREATFAAGESVAHTVCVLKDDSGGVVHLLTPSVDAVVLASLLMGFTGSLIAEKRKSGFDEELLDAFGEVMNLGAASLGRIFSEQAELPDLRASGTTEIEAPEADDQWLPEGSYHRALYRLEMPEGQPEGSFSLLIPSEQAEEWFGGGDGGAAAPKQNKPVIDQSLAGAAAPKQNRPVIDQSLAGSGPIVFVDADEDSRQSAEDLEEELDRSIWTFSPSEFGPETIDEVEEASAFVIAWNLDGRSGLDMMESLKSDPRTSAIPVVLVSPEPTKQMVTAALNAGAHSFAFQPYDSRELRVRLVEVLGMAEDEGSDDEADSAAEGDGSDQASIDDTSTSEPAEDAASN